MAVSAGGQISVGAADVELEIVVIEPLAIGLVGFEPWNVKVGIVCCCCGAGESENSSRLHGDSGEDVEE